MLWFAENPIVQDRCVSRTVGFLTLVGWILHGPHGPSRQKKVLNQFGQVFEGPLDKPSNGAILQPMMNKQDILDLILEHAENQGYDSITEDSLKDYTEQDLSRLLDQLEDSAVYATTMPRY